MERPKYGQIWRLKSDKARTLKINYVNCNDIVGFTDATYRKRRYGTMRLDVFLRRYEIAL